LQVKQSVAHISLYIGLKVLHRAATSKKQITGFILQMGIMTLSKRYLNDLSQPFPVVYLSFPSAKDPD
jgi:all-trans-retinol 13,14-reductase